MTQIIQSNAELERMSQDNATEKMSFLSPDFPSFSGTKEAIKQEKEQEKEFTEDERRLEEEGVVVDFTKCKIREVQDMYPRPKDLDPYSEALFGGVDPMAEHQSMTLSYPMWAFLAQNARVVYQDMLLRWMSGQSYQGAGSGCGKSVVLRSLEGVFLCKELEESKAAAMRAAEYALLSEKERKETPKPREKVFILDSIPTAIALLEQMQINGGGAIYLSCSECGEFGKKIQTRFYSLVLDMMKKSYDGVGEPYMHKSSDKTYYVPSMKICCNIGGCFDEMYKILHQCDGDGTLSRGAVTIIGERKDEATEGPYKAPSWTKGQLDVLLKGAERLRQFNNTYRENDNHNHNDNENDPYSDEVYERAHDSEGNIPTRAEYDFSVQEQRKRLALCVPEIIALGKEVKRYLAQIGEIADDCCSRADERAQAMAYILYIANGLAEIPEGERDDQYHETLRRIINVSRWWVNRSIDCALAIQTQLNANSKSHREEIRAAYKQTMGVSVTRIIYNEREEVLKSYEQEHAGEIVTVREVRDSSEILKRVVLRTVQRNISDRGWKEIARGKWRVPEREENDNDNDKR